MKTTGRKMRSRRPFAIVVGVLCFALAAPRLSGQEAPAVPEGLKIKEIRLDGLKRTKESVVTRELVSRVGEPYRAAHITEERSRLERLDIFAEILVEARAEEDAVVLTYRFVEMLSFLPSLSVQITDENGVTAGLGLKMPNFRGRDISLSARAMGGGSSLVQFMLLNPWFAGKRIGYELEYYYRERDNKIVDFLEIAHEFSLSFSAPLGVHGKVGWALDYVGIRSDRAGVTLSPDNVDQVTRVGLFYEFDGRDAFVGTHRGWWAEVRLSKEARLFRSASDFVQIDLDLRRYQPLPFGERHTLTLYSLLTLRTGTVGTDVAPWQRFGMGGTNTVRGWDYASQVGKNQFIGTAEYSFTLMKPRLIKLPFKIRWRGGLQLCVFGDMGLAWDEPSQFELANFLGGVGVGVRILVPVVGMVRLDLGWGQSGRARLHAGSFEKAYMARRRVR